MRLNHTKLLLTGLLLVLAPSALASTTWYVNGGSGSDSNNCMAPTTACKTIGHAISLAATGDTIMVASATYTENLTISISLNVIGSGASTTIVDGAGVNPVVRISASTTSTVVLSGLTIHNNGQTAGGAGVINNSGNLTITGATISGNRASVNGGGRYNFSTLTINNSTISGNVATGFCGFNRRSIWCNGGRGGGIYNTGTLTINNSTISGNVAQACRTGYTCRTQGAGGGIDNHGALTISNSTISGNGAPSGGGISGPATLQNGIIANSQGGNCGGPPTSRGYNLSSDGTCNFSSSGDRNNIDPSLGSLQYNGGPTQTQALLPGSPAIDGGNPSGCTDGSGRLMTTDQRGMPRPDSEDKTGCDMGAYERQSD